MTREEAKELLPIIQAFAEGKTIEYREYGGEWKEAHTPTWSSRIFYRIKPEPKYRPFKNVKECWDEMQKHQPVGWLKSKKSPQFYSSYEIGEGSDWDYRFNTYTFADGTPYGIKEE